MHSLYSALEKQETVILNVINFIFCYFVIKLLQPRTLCLLGWLVTLRIWLLKLVTYPRGCEGVENCFFSLLVTSSPFVNCSEIVTRALILVLSATLDIFARLLLVDC